jgi:anaerobic nitric oxide reductase flavorubredoxin
MIIIINKGVTMKITMLNEGIHQLSINVENILFEGLWPMPNGVSINSYVVKGKNTALIDGVCGWDGVPETLYGLLEELSIDPKTIRYLVVNHLEPDHAGWIEDFRKIHSNFEVICTESGSELLSAFYGGGLSVRTVKSDDTLDLGNGRILSFKETPHVHWPDAMVTYDQLSHTLFTCDIFGSFGQLEGSPYADDYSDDWLKDYEKETVRYYSNIVSAFSPFVPKAIAACSDLKIDLIAPGHGLMWRAKKDKIISDYLDYARYQKGQARKEITLIWGSMYGMTQKAVEVATRVLEESGLSYHSHQVPESSWGDILTSAWTSSGIILAMPTYEYKMFPPMAAALEEMGKKKVNGRLAFRFGSYGWSGGAQKELDELHERLRLKWNFLPSYEFKGSPLPEDLIQIRKRVQDMVDAIKAMKD